MKYIFILILFITSVTASDLVYIKNEASAVKVGETFLSIVYGDTVLKQRPFKVSSTDSTWILEGTLNCPAASPCLGGVVYIEFRKSDGKIIKVQHTK